MQSEKTLQGERAASCRSEWTLDNFTVILTQGQQKGRIFEQATYLPDNIKSFYRAFANSLIVALGVTLLTVGFGALSAYTVARLKLRWALWLMQANVVARFLPAIVLMIPLYVVMRSLGQLNSLHAVDPDRDRLPAALRHRDPGAVLRQHPGRSRGRRADRRLHAFPGVLADHPAAVGAGACRLRA